MGKAAVFLSIISFLVIPNLSLAEENMHFLQKGTQEIGLGSGYGWSIDSNQYVASVPLNFHWGCIFTDPKGPSFLKGNWEVIAEGSFSYLFHGQRKYGIGIAGLIRYNFLAGKRLAPYIQGGVGIWHTNLEMHNFPNDFNFSPQGGVGIQYFITRNTAIQGEYRYQHFSNANLYKDNAGLDMNNFWIGYAYYF
jgi:opacity protein-like surface antigen